MSNIIQNNPNFEEIQNKEDIIQPNNFQYKKIINNQKYNNFFSNESTIPLNSNILNANQILENLDEHNYAQNLFNEKENLKLFNDNDTNININQNINNSISNINNNNNFLTNKKVNINQKFITINDIIGEKCEINLDLLKLFFNNYEPSKISRKKMGVVKSYGVNTYQGIVRNYNEDRVSIIINMNKPKDYIKGKWPKTSFFAIYDGHGGEGCSEYLRDNLHKLICNNEYFPENIPEAIKLGISKAEQDFLNNYALSENKQEIIDKSGSCAIIILIVDTNIYIANVGDSRCLLSMNNGNNYIEVTNDHKPNSPNEIIRIRKNGGNIYQSQTIINNTENNNINGKILIGPYRVLPGRLSVSRTIGDAEAKLVKFGGNPNVIICEPEIFYYDLKKENIDFFILGCDGIYDQMTNKEVLDCAWMVLNEKEHILVKECNNLHNESGLIADLIIKSSLARKSFDNVTCVFISLKDFGTKPLEISNNEDIPNNYVNTQKIFPSQSYSGLERVTDDQNKEVNFEKIYSIKRKSKVLSKDSIKDFPNEESKCKTNRNNNKEQILSGRFTNNYNDKSFNTDFKLKKLKLLKDIEKKNNEENHIQNLSMKDFGVEKNHKNFRKIQTKQYIQKLNNENNNHHNMNNRISHSRFKNNYSIAYSKKKQSFPKVNKYLINLNNSNNYNNNNNYKQVKKNINFNYNSYTTKKTSEGNANVKQNNILDKIMDKSNINNHNNSHIFKHSSKFNINQPLKIVESKNSFTNSAKNLALANKSSIILNNLNKNFASVNTKSHRFLLANKEKRNSDYISYSNSNKLGTQNNININEKIKKNFINLNEQYKFNSQLMNNFKKNNNNNISSFYGYNINPKKSKNHLSLNSGENINNSVSISNNYIMNRNQTNGYSSRAKKDINSKLREVSMQKSLPNNNFKLNHKMNMINSSHNLSMQTMQLHNNLYNNKNQKINKNINKKYQNSTYNFSNKNNSVKFNSYLFTDLKKSKKELLYEDNKKNIY